MIRKSHGVALAALALAATGAFAQSSVNIYGILDAGFGSFSSFTAGASSITTKHTTAVQNGLMDASFIGFRGSEDLGGGNKAIFSLESYLDTTTGKSSGGGDTGGFAGGSGFWARNTFVGLEGGYGRVTLGHTDSLVYQAVTSYSPFMASDYFSPVVRQLFDNSASVLGNTFGLGLDQGWSKVITYTSPDMSGFNVAAQYAPKSDNTLEGSNWGLAGNYNNGPLGLNASYEQLKRPFTAGSGEKLKVWSLNASYDFSVVKAFGQWAQTKDDGVGFSDKDRLWQLGVSAPVGASGAVLASFGQSKITSAGVPGSFQGRDFSLGYDYTLSKRTMVYAALLNERAKIDTGAGSDSKSGNTFAVGVHHAF